MNTFEFFNKNFGKYLTEQTNRPHMDAWHALSKSHPMINKEGKKSSSRLGGWAIIRSGSVITQFNSIEDAIVHDTRTRFEAFEDELNKWDGSPRIFLSFDKAPIPIANLFMTVDLRAVRICTPGGVEAFDYTKPTSENSGVFQRNIEKWRIKNAA
tara:strand:+ start:545 stop:1009 length:465 start_codon:yes stop_codon:yes gene_type:complete